MSLRRKLLLLMAMFGLYAVVAAGAAIIGIQLRVGHAGEQFRRVAGQSTNIEKLELYLTEMSFLLDQLAGGSTHAMARFASVQSKWRDALVQHASFTPVGRDARWREFLETAEAFDTTCLDVLEHAGAGRATEADALLRKTVRQAQVPQMRTLLDAMKADLSASQNKSARLLETTAYQALVLTIAVAGLAALLVVVGAGLTRRWLLRPIAHLQAVTAQFRAGNLAARSEVSGDDELGELGAALNEMAGAVASSEEKHRTLFTNLRDALVLCDRDTTVVEYHDGDEEILGVAPHQHIGRKLLEIFPAWRRAMEDWPAIIRSAIDEGRRVRLHDVHIPADRPAETEMYLDFVIYPVVSGAHRWAGIVARNVSQRRRLQDRLRHAETMEAIGTMAGGFAHDVNNLLAGALGSISSLAKDLTEPQQIEHATRAERACKRAAGLSKRLLNFAQGMHGTPQVFSPAEVVRTILEAMESPEGEKIHAKLNDDVKIHMDQDQFAQILMNLVSNARDATSAGGRVEVILEPPDPPGEVEGRSFALLAVRDEGTGMPPDVATRVFEPFFTTKTRTGTRGRGMGLALVYSAVKHAGGHVRIDSRPEVGTTVSIYLPTCNGAA